ncbi:hypothetical protein TSOC_005751 [Tetrabaena socialis]|uniref:DUF6570 domain-containing protein n=1 Tax=Tetrabaena socialis TaxID=47790 RepID=A0A2J8A5E4_9CHLO|nr:hypothetical protein TSOC_005751 [Tetrabaena socialis]|eukprot:PNH07730.1 hypothetical protein TSOC_005751 [Tetrabaena socialis]
MAVDALLVRAEDALGMKYFRRENPITPELPSYIEEHQHGWPARVQDLPEGELPPQVPYTEHIKLAVEMAQTAEDTMPSLVCAVCSCVRPPCETHRMPIVEIPNVELLRADILRTPSVPRHAHTLFWRRVPLAADGQPPKPPPPAPATFERKQHRTVQATAVAAAASIAAAFVEGGAAPDGQGSDSEDEEVAALLAVGSDEEEDEDGGTSRQVDLRSTKRARPAPYTPETTYRPSVQSRPCEQAGHVEVPYCLRVEAEGANRTLFVDRVNVCESCLLALRRGRLPAASLACIDPGDIPPTNSRGHPLLPLKHAEALIVSRVRTIIRVFVLHTADTPAWRPADTLPVVMRGHSLAFPNPAPGELARCIPFPLHQLDQLIQCLLLDAVASREELEEKIRKAECVQIRGAAIAAWLEHAMDQEMVLDIDPQHIEEYRALSMEPVVPEAIVRHAIAAHDSQLARVLQLAYANDRAGPSGGVRQQQDAIEAAVAATITGES